MDNDPYQTAKDHMMVTDWLTREADKVTERYIEIEKRIQKCEMNFSTPSEQDIEELEKILNHMVEIENRMIYEEKQYVKIMKRLDDMDF
jgi:predicted aldo/keto reductase-like oxidoreductase